MLYEKPDDLTSAEKEILLLKAAYESINSIVNYMVFDITGTDPDSEIWFKSEIHQRYFIILLTDFLGLSTLPIINQMVANKFPAAEISNDNKFGSVGLGLAYNAEYVF